MTPLDPFALTRVSLQTGLMLWEAQQVMAMRVLGLMGLWRTRPGENARMLQEKIDAAGEAGRAMGLAMARGAAPAAVAGAALKPYARRTAANRRRLTRSGPGTPT